MKNSQNKRCSQFAVRPRSPCPWHLVRFCWWTVWQGAWPCMPAASCWRRHSAQWALPTRGSRQISDLTILSNCSCPAQLALTIQLEAQEWRKYGNKTGLRRSRVRIHDGIADKKMRKDVVMGVGFHRNGERWWRHFDCTNTLRFLSDIAHQNGGLGLFCPAQFAVFLIRSGRHFFVFPCSHVTSLMHLR